MGMILGSCELGMCAIDEETHCRVDHLCASSLVNDLEGWITGHS